MYLAALTLVSYDRGYKTIVGRSQVENWIGKKEKSTIISDTDDRVRIRCISKQTTQTTLHDNLLLTSIKCSIKLL